MYGSPPNVHQMGTASRAGHLESSDLRCTTAVLHTDQSTNACQSSPSVLWCDLKRCIPSAVAAIKNSHIRSEMYGPIPIEAPTLVFGLAALTVFYRCMSLQMGEHVIRERWCVCTQRTHVGHAG